jgi:hypothetical protein
MTDPPRYLDTGTSNDTGAQADGGPTGGRSHWSAAAVWIIATAVLLLMLVLHLTGVFGPGSHG